MISWAVLSSGWWTMVSRAWEWGKRRAWLKGRGVGRATAGIPVGGPPRRGWIGGGTSAPGVGGEGGGYFRPGAAARVGAMAVSGLDFGSDGELHLDQHTNPNTLCITPSTLCTTLVPCGVPLVPLVPLVPCVVPPVGCVVFLPSVVPLVPCVVVASRRRQPAD